MVIEYFLSLIKRMRRVFIMKIYSMINVCVLICVDILITITSPAIQAQSTETDTVKLETVKSPFGLPLQWTSTGILVSPVPDETHKIASVKDPTIVRYNDLWHIYTTVFDSLVNSWSMVYLNFKNWADAPKAKLTFIDINPDLIGYHCAPNLFYFRPHKKWYLIFQSQQPQYCTTD
jgi:hypothetical protein